MQDFVLDAWPVLEWLEARQPVAERMRRLLEANDSHNCSLCINIVNLGEVFYIAAKRRNLEEAGRILESLRRRVITISADDELVLLAANLKARHPISYADGFAAATAILQKMPLVTGDPEIRAMAAKEKSLKLEWIG